MAQYPNYYPNNNMQQMYMGYTPVMTPQQRYPQMEQQYPQFPQQIQFQPQQAMPQQIMGLNGRYVDDFNTLSANDVPMDGNGAIFIKKDKSEIQLKNWTANGTIATTCFKPITEQNFENNINMPQINLNGLYEDMRALRGEIAERFDRLEKSMTNSTNHTTNSMAKTSVSKTKKETEAE